MQTDRWQRYLRDQYVKFGLALLVVSLLVPDKFTGKWDANPWWLWLVLPVISCAFVAVGIIRTNRK